MLQYQTLFVVTRRALASAATAIKEKEKVLKYPVTGMTRGPLAIFVKEYFAKKTPKNLSEGKKIMEEAASAWKSLDSTQRKKYEELSKQYRDQKMHEFDALPEEEKKKRIAASLEMKEERARRRERKERRENWEKTGHPERPPSAYNLFIQEKFNELKKKGEVITPVAKTMQRVSAEWSSMSDSAKQKYITKASKMADHYKVQLDIWKSKIKPEEKEKSQKSSK
ncbi:HMG box [Oesophagostomum dentatum]|uniref:HMG box n=1 Tax=Oesophagostomum dentatum TaxID=61180 RepID=A0A0B1SDT1_OESDE|nr:HMG box [Oesophagostomum dentatum]